MGNQLSSLEDLASVLKRLRWEDMDYFARLCCDITRLPEGQAELDVTDVASDLISFANNYPKDPDK